MKNTFLLLTTLLIISCSHNDEPYEQNIDIISYDYFFIEENDPNSIQYVPKNDTSIFIYKTIMLPDDKIENIRLNTTERGNRLNLMITTQKKQLYKMDTIDHMVGVEINIKVEKNT